MNIFLIIHYHHTQYSQEEYTSSDVSNLGITTVSPSVNCLHVFESGLKMEPCQLLSPSYDLYGICQYTECTANDGKTCIFPFK